MFVAGQLTAYITSLGISSGQVASTLATVPPWSRCSAVGGVRHVVYQPVQVGGDPGVHPGPVGLSAAGAEAGDADQTALGGTVPGGDAQRSAFVELETRHTATW